MLEDRLTRGFIAGLAGGTAMNILNLIYVHFNNHCEDCRYFDWSAVLLYGNKATSMAEIIIALIAQVVFTGFLSILFAFLVTLINSKHLWFKGWLYGILCWFFIYAVFIIFKIPEFGHRSVPTVISFFVTSSAYGIIQAEVIRRLDQKASMSNKP
jgi:hypothetical protein